MGDTITTLQQVGTSNLKTGVMRVDSRRYWVLPTDNSYYYGTQQKQGGFDLETMAMHQIGHLLGLDHNPNMESIICSPQQYATEGGDHEF